MEKNKEIKKAMVLSSGGVDSTTCLGMAVEKYGKDQVIALSISYGQKHQKEIEASRKVAEYYGVEHLYLDLAPIFQYSNCSLLKHSARFRMKAMQNSWRKQMGYRYQLMFRFGMAFFSHQQQVLHSQKDAV